MHYNRNTSPQRSGTNTVDWGQSSTMTMSFTDWLFKSRLFGCFVITLCVKGYVSYKLEVSRKNGHS